MGSVRRLARLLLAAAIPLQGTPAAAGTARMPGRAASAFPAPALGDGAIRDALPVPVPGIERGASFDFGGTAFAVPAAGLDGLGIPPGRLPEPAVPAMELALARESGAAPGLAAYAFSRDGSAVPAEAPVGGADSRGLARAEVEGKFEAVSRLAQGLGPTVPAESALATGREIESLLSGALPRRGEAALGVRTGLERVPFGLRHGDHDHDHDHGVHAEHGPEGAPAPALPPEVRSRFRLYALGLAAVKIGIESINLVVPLFLIAQLHSAAAVGVLFVAADLAGLGGSFLGGWLSDRLRPSRVMLATTLIQAVAVSAMILSAGTAFAIPAVVGLFMLNGALSEVFGVARKAALPILVGRDEGTLRVYNGRAYIWRELAATAGVFAVGWLADARGYAAALWLHPVFYLAAAYAFFRLSGRAAGGPLSGLFAMRGPRRAVSAALKELTRGARIVWADSRLRLGLLVNAPVLVTHKLFHALVGTLFAAQVLGNPALAALILGAWNIGELGAALLLDRRGHAIGTSAWLRFAAAAGLASWGFWLFPSLWVAIPVAALMGVATLASELALASFFQAAAPEEDQGAVTGFAHALGTAASMAALLIISFFFDLAGASTGFLFLALAFTAVSGLYFWAASALKPPPSTPD